MKVIPFPRPEQERTEQEAENFWDGFDRAHDERLMDAAELQINRDLERERARYFDEEDGVARR